MLQSIAAQSSENADSTVQRKQFTSNNGKSVGGGLQLRAPNIGEPAQAARGGSTRKADPRIRFKKLTDTAPSVKPASSHKPACDEYVEPKESMPEADSQRDEYEDIIYSGCSTSVLPFDEKSNARLLHAVLANTLDWQSDAEDDEEGGVEWGELPSLYGPESEELKAVYVDEDDYQPCSLSDLVLDRIDFSMFEHTPAC